MRTTALRRRPTIDKFSSSKERSFLSFRASHTMNEDKYTTLIILMHLRWSCHLFNESFVNKFFVAFPLLFARKYRNIWTRKQLAKFISSSFFLYFFLPFFLSFFFYGENQKFYLSNVGKIQRTRETTGWKIWQTYNPEFYSSRMPVPQVERKNILFKSGGTANLSGGALLQYS